jgi:outer membrane protein OmpA-like peptidoglycan-associated protein
MKATNLLILPLVALLAACSSTVKKEPLPLTSESEERIIYRSLTQKPITYVPVDTTHSVGVVTADSRPANTTMVRVPDYYIQFSNESASLDLDLNKNMPAIDGQAHYFVLGHSHGFTSVGNAKLAQLRTVAVANWLHQNGIAIDHIHMMASWSSVKELDFPVLGVQVYKLKDINDMVLFGSSYGQS